MITIFIGLILTRINNTWAFMWQSFGVIRSYRPLTLLPVISLVFCFLVSVIVLGGGALVLDIPIRSADFAPARPRVSGRVARHTAINRLAGDNDGDSVPRTAEARKQADHAWLLLFLFYVANYFVIVYFHVAFASIVLDRMGGGNASLDDGLRVAWSRKYSILQWVLLSATVGILLKMIRERSVVERWVASIVGYVWRVATYFVMPLLALENLSPGEAFHRSTALLKDKWGEVIVAGFSFSLLFFVLALPGLALFFPAAKLGQAFGFAAILATSYWLLLAIIIFCAEQVFVAALYLYAKEDKVPVGFSRSDLSTAWEGLKPLPAGQAP